MYPILYNKWASLVQCVSKRGGMTTVKNQKNELIPMKTVTCWHICMDYNKLANTIRKDHYPVSFIDQMSNRLAGQYYCLLEGYLGYNQIVITSEE